MRIAWLVVSMAGVLGLSGCAQMAQLMESPQGKQFCAWAPVAVVAIRSAAEETRNDPAKRRAGEALVQAAAYLQLAASQCPGEPATP